MKTGGIDVYVKFSAVQIVKKKSHVNSTDPARSGPYEKDLKAVIGRQVNTSRTRHNMTFTELAKEAGINAPNICNYLDGLVSVIVRKQQNS